MTLMRALELRLIRYTLATVWLVTGVLSLGVFSVDESLTLLENVGLHGLPASLALFGAASLDMVLGLCTLLTPSRTLWCAQALLVLFYSIVIACCLPAYYLHPFGPVLKNLPILLLLRILYVYKEEPDE